MLGLGLGDWVSVKVRFGWRIREAPCLQIQGEIYTHSELLRTSGVRRGVGVNESVKKGHPGSQGELGSKGTVRDSRLASYWCSRRVDIQRRTLNSLF